VVIKASSHTQVDALIADLQSDRPATREAAITRLTVIGARALERLMALTRDGRAAPASRTAALRTLEAIGDPRSLEVILTAVDAPDEEVAAAAVGAARVFLRTSRGAAATGRLTATALDRRRADVIRAAAIRALSELEPSTLKPLYAALLNDPSPAIAALVARPSARAPRATDGVEIGVGGLAQAIEGDLPSDPAALRDAVTRTGSAVSLPLLHRLVERIREREAAAPERRADWMRVRGAVHAALANRDSRLALYDLRETLESSTEPLPVEFLAALRQIGDASCLEAIAAAYTRAMGPQESGDWWRRHLADAFRTIRSRERMTRRHAVMKRIEKRWPAILEER
jgi:HEAT repeat protein